MLVPRFLWDVTSPNRSQEMVAVGGAGTHKACQEDRGDDLLTSAHLGDCPACRERTQEGGHTPPQLQGTGVQTLPEGRRGWASSE